MSYFSRYRAQLLSYQAAGVEQSMGISWIDGKEIFRKVVDCGALPDTTTKNTAHKISSLGRFVLVEGVSIDVSNNVTLPLPYFNTGTGYVKLYANATNVVLVTGTDLTSYDSTHVTLYYTKT